MLAAADAASASRPASSQPPFGKNLTSTPTPPPVPPSSSSTSLLAASASPPRSTSSLPVMLQRLGPVVSVSCRALSCCCASWTTLACLGCTPFSPELQIHGCSGEEGHHRHWGRCKASAMVSLSSRDSSDPTSPPRRLLTELLTKEDLVAYVASECKPKENWR
ncbi:unnamed protein product [Triticum turgidum subsp. durum]|uniref:Uncharacterized protein n=1 Tax=Triticum turgidum subsp. durum TaxID=4567 RepID=A0A9R1ALM0_TRITD|nr:unnamed protein product [Triticum turgidum subsp. durum]